MITRLRPLSRRTALVSASVVLAAGLAAAALAAPATAPIDQPGQAYQPARRLPARTVVPPPVPGPSQPGVFPTSASVGVPAGWAPARTVAGNLTVSQAGAVISDVRVNGSVIVTAPNVTLRRVDVVGGQIENMSGKTCAGGLVVEDSTVRRGSRATTSEDPPAIGTGGYTARRTKIEGLPEGFRVGGRASGQCGPVVIEQSFVNIVAPDQCGDWHGDGLQGYDGPAVTVRNTVIQMVERSGCGGTAPFFYPEAQGNTSVDIDGLIVSGGGASFRLGTPGVVRNLAVVNGSWFYSPTSVKCSLLASWDARIVRLDANGQPQTVRSLAC